MSNKLITDLSRVFDYRYVDENEYNFKLISDMLTDLNFLLNTIETKKYLHMTESKLSMNTYKLLVVSLTF